jgi:competence protein ComEC
VNRAEVADAAARVTPHLLLGSLCLGLAASVVARAPSPAWAIVPAAAAVLIAAIEEGGARPVLIAIALVLAGWAWGCGRVARLDASALESRVGDAGLALVAVTGPPRRGAFTLRMSAEVRRWGREPMREPVLLELPLGRAPPQGTLLEVVGEVRSPRLPDETGGFDERGWLRRQGIQVVVRASHPRVVGRRGGFAGVADRLRAWLQRSLGPGLTGERHAVLAGVVLGADEGLTADLRDRFRSSGLYHLLRVDQ